MYSAFPGQISFLVPSFQKLFRPVISEWKVPDCAHVAVSLATSTSSPKSFRLTRDSEQVIMMGKGRLSPATIREFQGLRGSGQEQDPNHGISCIPVAQASEALLWLLTVPSEDLGPEGMLCDCQRS